MSESEHRSRHQSASAAPGGECRSLRQINFVNPRFCEPRYAGTELIGKSLLGVVDPPATQRTPIASRAAPRGLVLRDRKHASCERDGTASGEHFVTESSEPGNAAPRSAVSSSSMPPSDKEAETDARRQARRPRGVGGGGGTQREQRIAASPCSAHFLNENVTGKKGSEAWTPGTRSRWPRMCDCSRAHRARRRERRTFAPRLLGRTGKADRGARARTTRRRLAAGSGVIKQAERTTDYPVSPAESVAALSGGRGYVGVSRPAQWTDRARRPLIRRRGDQNAGHRQSNFRGYGQFARSADQGQTTLPAGQARTRSHLGRSTTSSTSFRPTLPQTTTTDL